MHYDESTALIVVDVQNDFADPAGSLYVSAGEQVIPYINEQVAAAREAGATLVYTQDWHPPSTPHFEKDGGVWPVHCVADTWGAELQPELFVLSDALRIRKGVGGEDGYSGFNVRDPETGDVATTGLARMLAERGVRRLAVLGIALDYCVKETATDGAGQGFETTLLADGTRPVNLRVGDGARAVASMVAAGVEVD